MSNHNHHHCECEHKRLSFCPKCKVPHCLDCGKEWVEPCTRAHYEYYYTGTGTTATYRIPNTTFSDATPTVTCSHLD